MAASRKPLVLKYCVHTVARIPLPHLAQAVVALQQASSASTSGASVHRPLLALVSGLGRRLEASGALSPVPNTEVVALYSTHLIDLLPKQWAEGGNLYSTHLIDLLPKQWAEGGNHVQSHIHTLNVDYTKGGDSRLRCTISNCIQARQ